MLAPVDMLHPAGYCRHNMIRFIGIGIERQTLCNNVCGGDRLIVIFPFYYIYIQIRKVCYVLFA